MSTRPDEEPASADANDATLVATESSEVAVGSAFAGRYLIERLLGRGGMGAVYAAFDRHLEERVALKLLDAPPGRDASALARFRREVRLARRVTHHNTARTFDIGEHAGAHYLTMELVDGVALDQLLRQKGALPVERATEIARQLCLGLTAAHAAGVIHRDLKPANVLVAPDGRVVITDFGIARQIEDDARVTVAGTDLVGTPAYMAPEQVAGGTIDERVDLYAVGLILFEMLTGKLPFSGDTPLATAVARLERQPPNPRSLADIPEELAQLVLACLARDPDHRPSTAACLANALAAHASCTGEWSVDAAHEARPQQTRSAKFATTASTSRGLAVLPFVYRGPPDDAYLADVLTDELIDLLSMTRGLKVPSRGATANYERGTDPRELGRQLDVDAIVDGTVQIAGKRLRISARLVDVQTGYQTWSERFDGNLEDVFDLQDRMAKRIAETLRLRLETFAHRGEVSEEASELYLRARSRMNDMASGGLSEDGAIALFERCLALAPEFHLARAGHAMACINAWYLPELASDRKWSTRCAEAVAEALEHAPELAETHLAASRLALHRGEFGKGAQSLRTALEIAPTYAAAHAHLGALQTEAGRVDEGLRHIQLASELDPTNVHGLFATIRVHALHGELDAVEAALDTMRTMGPSFEMPITMLEMRVRAWVGDKEGSARLGATIERIGTDFARYVAKVYHGECGLEVLDPLLSQPFDDANLRFLTLGLQMSAEACGLHGDDERMLRFVRRAADQVLVDLLWLERCPPLRGVRSRDEYETIHAKVRARAEAIWKIE
jgi:eukaryotic-like serine/threonine-protein kinase